jgi:hypothetical protein
VPKSHSQLEGEGWEGSEDGAWEDYWTSALVVESSFRRPGLGDTCRCVWSDQAMRYARHPECAIHPPWDEIGFWGSITIAVGDYL